MEDTSQNAFLDDLTNTVAPGASWRWIGRPDGKEKVADATLAVTLEHASGGEDVLLVSNADFPDAVAEAVAMIDAVAEAMTVATAARLLRPSADGRMEGRSYALFPRLATLSEAGLGGRIEKRLVAPHVTAWLDRVAQETRRACPPGDRAALFETPLGAVVAEDDFSAPLRRLAERHLNDLPDDLFTIVEHTDFWTGNVLLAPGSPALLAAARGDFRVIDWRGAKLEGYPFGDLLRFCMSAYHRGARRPRDVIARQARALGVSPGRVALYVLVGIGRGGLARGAFPKPRYLALGERLHAYLARHGFTEA